MRQGRNILDLADELQRQQETKRDFVADTRALEIDESGMELDGLNGHKCGISSLAHEQIGQRVGIPKKYYDKMREASPALLAQNVNHWFRHTPERRMVRTLDGMVRAFLSERYRPLDNIDMAQAVLPSIAGMECQIISAELTDRRLYIKAVTKKLESEVRPGDVVQAGIVVSNSEVGCGSVKVEPLIYRLVCSNGLIVPDHSLKKYHVGREYGGEDVQEFYRDETREADDKAFWMKLRDVVAGTLSQDIFARIVNKMREASERKIESDPVKVVEVTRERFGLTDDEKGQVLRHLIISGDLTAYGLSSAITRTSQDVPDYERATELERLGSEVITMPKREWEVIGNGTGFHYQGRT
jgi:hypothetical protein